MKQSTWQTPKVKLKVVGGKKKNAELCTSVTLIRWWLFCQEKEIPIQEFLPRIIAHSPWFFLKTSS